MANYGTQWDGLRFQTNQLVRELPAMAYGVNIFFGAISNNLPMFIDEVNKAREAQRLAIADGKTAPSVISRITGALFNWQTALVIGLTYLTMHGKEVVEWVKNLWGASTALEQLKKNQDDFNKATLLGRKNAQEEILSLKTYLGVVKDVSKSDEERAIALKSLREQYPFYFKNLTDAQILAGETAESENQLREALEKRKELEAKSEIDVKNRQRLVELNDEIEKQESEINKLRLYNIQIQKTKASQDVKARSTKQVYDAERELLKLQRERTQLAFDINSNEADIVRLKKETIGLEYQDTEAKKEKTKAKKEKTKANYDYVDVLVSEYELMKLLYEIEIERNKNIFEDEKATYSERGKATKEMYDNQLSLIELTKNEEIRLAEISSNELREKAKKARKDNVITEKEYISELINIAQVHSKKLMIIDEQYKTQKKK